MAGSAHRANSSVLLQVLVSIAAIRTTKALRVDFVKHTLRQNIAFFDSAETGGITTHITTNTNNANSGIAEKMTLTSEWHRHHGMCNWLTRVQSRVYRL
jgi:ABC-type multidrug transport system fused ATPase/permease subunit